MDIQQLKLEKLNFLSDLFDLTVKQRYALKDNDLDRLDNLIDAKEKLMEKIDKIDLVLKESRDDNREDNAEDEKIQVTLKNIMEIDRENQSLAQQLFVTFQKKIGQTNNARKFNKAYQSNFPDAMLINKVR